LGRFPILKADAPVTVRFGDHNDIGQPSCIPSFTYKPDRQELFGFCLSYNSSEEEEANLCLMTKQESETSSVSSSSSIDSKNYSQLFNAFKETYEEANRLALLNN